MKTIKPSVRSLVIVAAILPATWGLSQVPVDSPRSASSRAKFGQDVRTTESAQQREWKAQLRTLRQTEATLGNAHPSLPAVREQIAAIEKRLESAAGSEIDPARQARSSTPANSMLADADLRQVLAEMADRIQRLEARVKTLEDAIRVH
ncbi:hypothetical protein K227x_46660 [Rubripirellula lacrimiformis]|uniref:Uncharacterized protein n=1 Tax=Rubripirellula lacrimiformis TaxID=1930273 RepID=A0A517NGJ2_9BACT|nr:hypothetical protein [Rubripirellula lacrimiformis]QDT06257.1 hypothetical protein K227x_46660 [Rubripirellula lacrimiformis]